MKKTATIEIEFSIEGETDMPHGSIASRYAKHVARLLPRSVMSDEFVLDSEGYIPFLVKVHDAREVNRAF